MEFKLWRKKSVLQMCEVRSLKGVDRRVLTKVAGGGREVSEDRKTKGKGTAHKHSVNSS